MDLRELPGRKKKSPGSREHVGAMGKPETYNDVDESKRFQDTEDKGKDDGGAGCSKAQPGRMKKSPSSRQHVGTMGKPETPDDVLERKSWIETTKDEQYAGKEVDAAEYNKAQEALAGITGVVQCVGYICDTVSNASDEKQAANAQEIKALGQEDVTLGNEENDKKIAQMPKDQEKQAED